MALVVRMLNEDPALRPSIIKVVDTLAAISEFSGHCCSPTPSRSSSINNAKSRVLQSVDHRTTPLSPEGSYFPVPHSQITSNGHYLSYQDSNLMFARGHKRSLAEASSGYQSDRAPTERTRPDYSVDDPRRLSTSGATNGMSKRRQLSIKIGKRPPPPPPPPPTTNTIGLSSVRPKPTFNAARESTTISPGIAHAKQLQLSRTPTELFTKQPLLLESLISTGPESTHFFSFGPRINVPPPVPPALSHLQPRQHFEPQDFEISRFEPRPYYSYSEATTPPRRLRSSTPR